jgi:hypothetical protein
VTDVGYVIAGYAVTAAALGAYWLRLSRRLRRAEADAESRER